MDNTNSMDRLIDPDVLRLIKSYSKGAVKVDVVYDTSYEEFQVRVWKHGRITQNATYYTENRADAVRTARVMFNAIAATMGDGTN